MLAWRERYNDLFGEGEAALASAFLVPTDTLYTDLVGLMILFQFLACPQLTDIVVDNWSVLCCQLVTYQYYS